MKTKNQSSPPSPTNSKTTAAAEVVAVAKYIRQSPRKIRVLANLIKNYPLDQAVAILEVSVRKAAPPLLKVIQSAIANAVNNAGLKKESLFLKELQINKGPVFKRWRARAKGRADQIRRPTAHIRVVLGGKK